MSEPPPRVFGKRVPETPPRKRSQDVRLKVMAGAGAAAIGLYALMPGGSCSDGRHYGTLDECLGGGSIKGDACREAFATAPTQTGLGTTPGGVLFHGGGGTVPVTRQSDGRLVTADGQLVGDALDCRRRSSSSHTSSRSSSSSGRSWWSRSASSSSADTGHAASRGGFGSSGHGFLGGS